MKKNNEKQNSNSKRAWYGTVDLNMCAEAKYRLASLSPGWVTTRVLGDEFLSHIKTRSSTNRNLPQKTKP